ncbi:NADH-quinone oxidoreductase subunit NuoK [Dyadobacter tibetensis]|uniref:NADH-quinone oxidoreductase subunit NuoK n=1 Tax=Dyadobacter tibetensis TaxID=1211851 RepID=UPI0004707B16|nr:NADH-quinone oxidoreductase subunit NuoK [Dyadobacter tibetensis]
MNTPDNIESILLLAALLFCIGMAGVMIRKNILFMLLSVEVMLNASGLAFIAAGAYWGQPDGQVMFLFILAMAAAEVSIGLALILQIYHLHRSLDIDKIKEMNG